MAARKQPKKATVTTGVFGANLRDEPDGKILPAVLPDGTSVEVLEERDGWARIDGGWIRARYLK